MLTSAEIFSEAEIRSRYEISLENYCKPLPLRADQVDMARKEILPAVESYWALCLLRAAKRRCPRLSASTNRRRSHAVPGW